MDERFLNRELSWLEFDRRVLAFAAEHRLPLLERVKYLAISSQNLDEFFQVRVAGLKDQVAGGVTRPTPDGRSPAAQLDAVRAVVHELVADQEALLHEELLPALARAGVVLVTRAELDARDRSQLGELFHERVFPVLTPLAVDPGHPFPYISDLSLNLAVVVEDPVRGDRRFARVKVPPVLPRFVALADGERYVPLEVVIAEHLDLLFPGMHVVEHDAFRVTRNADLALEEEGAEDLLAAVELELRRRRFGRAVRLELSRDTSDEVRHLLTTELDLPAGDVYPVRHPLDLSGLWSLYDLDRPDLKETAWHGVVPPALAPVDDEPVDVFSVLAKGDVLLHHPYDSFGVSVAEFIEQSADDPDVLAIKQTLYRTSGDSPVVQALIRAAESGKQVAALVEVKARFDEQANIAWARALEKAGVHVVYGLVGLKTHGKAALVVRQEHHGIRRYCHVSSGNYNPRTARFYEDLGLLSADPALGADLTQLFNYLTGYARADAYQRLLVAPVNLRERVAELIRGEIASPRGAIAMKLNALADPEMIELLYEASAAGVEVDLVVRGICCLRPGVPGLSERIRVRSIIGHHLEHSRIYRFANGNGPGRPCHFFGSADLMPRNLDRRVEVVLSVDDDVLARRLDEILEVNLADDVLAWELAAYGHWAKVPTVEGVDSHRRLAQFAAERAAVGDR